MLASRAAATEPFADFSAEALTTLAITRTYDSADVSLRGGPVGPFGRGWHHDWEATLTCSASGRICNVALGLLPGYQFQKAETALSLDGTEAWEIYRPTTSPSENRNVLVHRPGGLWSLYFAAGRELDFATVCDACGVPDAFCADPLAGGTARVVRAVGTRGEVVHIAYDRPSGLLIGLSDDLGHALEARTTAACTDGLARELRYDGSLVATYTYEAYDLLRAADADGATLRSYAYETTGSGLLLAVLNEAGDPVAEFSYDAQGLATGVHDGQSSVGIAYPATGAAEVTEYFGSSRSSTARRQLDEYGHILSVSEGCACGPAQTFSWSGGSMFCSIDSLGHVTWQEFDPLGRLTRRAEFKGTCKAPASSLLEIRDERRTYGLSRAIAQGVSIDLDIVTSITRPSALQSGNASVTLSYDPTPDAIDPPGYACMDSPLPVGSVPCREIESGYVYDKATTRAFERHATFYSYDARGRVVRRLGPVNLDRPSPNDVMPIEERSYWPDDETLARRGRLREVRRYPSPAATPLVTSYDYDMFGPFQITAPDGTVTTIVRDGRGRPRFLVGPGGARETRYHDGLSPRLDILATGAAVRSAYGPFGTLVSVERLSADPEQPGSSPVVGWSEHYLYDAAGNVTRTERRNAQGAVTWVREGEHDIQHRRVREAHPENAAYAKTWEYDASGFLTHTVDEEGRGTTFTPDGLNRVKSVTRSGVDAAGAPVSLEVASYLYEYRSDALRYVSGTQYKQDDFGRTDYVSSPTFGGGQVTYEHDARGNVLRRWDSYVTIDYTYDGLDRVLTMSARNSADGNTVAYSYAYDQPGEEGRLASIADSERTVRFTYDAAGRLESESVEENGVATPIRTVYAYDPDGALSGISYPSGLAVSYERDPATREVVRVMGADGTVFADAVSHVPGGPLSGLMLASGATVEQTYNARYEPLSIASGPLSLAYTPSLAGDVAGIAGGGAATAFGYDFQERLTSSGTELTYAYDGNGDRTGETVQGAAGRYQYSNDRVTWRQVPGATVGSWVNELAFYYDQEWNVAGLSRYSNGTVASAACFRHDALGRLVFAAKRKLGYQTCSNDAGVAAPIARFKYDARNRRVARSSAAGEEWTYFAHDASGLLLSELAKTSDPAAPWAQVRDYVWLDGRPIAQIEYVDGTRHRYDFHVDAIGLPRALTNESGQTVWSAVARPYGDITETASVDPLSGRTVVTNLRLPGQYDERLFAAAGISGLQGPYYNWNRWYLPSAGRYLELDPIALKGGMNGGWAPEWYTYGDGNPLTNIDPRGLQVPCELGESSISCKCKQPGGSWACGLDNPKPKKPVVPYPPPRPNPKPDCKDPKDNCEEHYKKCQDAANGYSLKIMDCIECEARCKANEGQWPWDALDFNDRRMCNYENPGWNH